MTISEQMRSHFMIQKRSRHKMNANFLISQLSIAIRIRIDEITNDEEKELEEIKKKMCKFLYKRKSNN